MSCAALSVPLADEEATSLSALAGALALAADNQRAATVLDVLPSGWRRPACNWAYGMDCKPTPSMPWNSSRWLPIGWCCAPPACSAVFEVAIYGGAATEGRLVYLPPPPGPVALETASRFPSADDQSAPGSLLAPMPGSIVRIAVAGTTRSSSGSR